MGSLQLSYGKRIRRRRKQVNMNDLLPREVVSDILSRIPVTCLPQVKLTCKLWKTLIDEDPSFPSRHLSHAVKNPGHLYTLIGFPNFYFAEKQSDNTTVAIGLPRQVENNDLGEDTLYLHKTNWLYKRQYASCHGLVCLFPLRQSPVYVFNPIIKQHVQLPPPLLTAVMRWGFGFAPLTGKYKCYCSSAARFHDNTLRFSSALYTLGDDMSWREMSCAPYPKIMSPCHVYSQGAFYWSLHTGHLNFLFPQVNFEPGMFNVLSLDLETEQFRERRIDLEKGTESIYLAIVGETVAAVAKTYNGLKVFYLIDEDKDTWEAKYTVPYLICLRSTVDWRISYHLDLMGLWMNQELYFSERVLLSSSRQVYDLRCFSFSPCDNKFIPLRFPSPKDVHAEITPQLILPHVGSLISPIKIMTTGSSS